MDPAIVIAVAGLITTACSPLIPTWRNARNQHTAALGDLRNALYVDATIYAQILETMLDGLTDAYSMRRGNAETTHQDSLTARMRLIAPSNVESAWTELITAEEGLRWEMQENYPGFSPSDGDAVPTGNESVVRLKTAVAGFYVVTRRVAIKGK